MEVLFDSSNLLWSWERVTLILRLLSMMRRRRKWIEVETQMNGEGCENSLI